MHFRTSKPEEPELNLVPLIDVLLMTLIFLVVTTSFSKETQLRIRLPQAAAQAQVTEPTLRIVVDAIGGYYINDSKLADSKAATLRIALSQAAQGKKDPIIIVHADARTPHEYIVRVMDSARRLNFTNLTFAAQEEVTGSTDE